MRKIWMHVAKSDVGRLAACQGAMSEYVQGLCAIDARSRRPGDFSGLEIVRAGVASVGICRAKWRLTKATDQAVARTNYTVSAGAIAVDLTAAPLGLFACRKRQRSNDDQSR